MKDIFTKDEQGIIISMYQKQIPIDEIIQTYNTDEHNIRLILKENQVDRVYNNFTKELSDRIIFLHQSKLLHKDIRYALLVSDVGINKTLDRNNIPRSSASERNRRYKRNSEYFDVIDSPNKAYLLGLLFADGCNYTSHSAITLSLQTEDEEVVNYLKMETEYEGPIRYNRLSQKNPNYKDQAVLVINDPHMSRSLSEKGMVDSKSLVLKFPQWLSKEYYSHFIRGYFDGDGGLCLDQKLNKGAVHITGTLDMCDNIKNILNELNIRSSIFHPKQSLDHNTYVVQISGTNEPYLFYKWLYQDADLKMERKYVKYTNFIEGIKSKLKVA